MQRLEAPAAGDELVGEPVQNFRVRRHCSKFPKIGGSRNQSFTEMVHPYAVDDHSCEQRVVSAGEPPGEGESAAGRREFVIVERKLNGLSGRTGDAERRGRDCLLRLLMVASVEQFRFGRVVWRFDESTNEFLDRFLRSCFSDLRVELFQFLSSFGKILIESTRRDVDAGILRQQFLLQFQ